MRRINVKIAEFSSWAEIYLSIIILIAVVLASIELLKSVYQMIATPNAAGFFQEFLGFAMALIIAVEFVKMLSKHTLGSTIEVLVFALARKLIVGDSKLMDLLLGVLAIAVLFGIRKYLYVPGFNFDEELPLKEEASKEETSLEKKV